MTWNFRCALLLLAILLTLSACDSAKVDNTPLNAMESEEMITSVLAVMADTTAPIKAFHSQSDSQVDVTIVCPQGGEARSVTSILEFGPSDPDASFGFETSIELKPSECAVGSYTLDGGTGLTFRFKLVLGDFFEFVSLEGELTGTTDWSLMDRSGSCEADMDIEVELGDEDSEGATFLTGTACDHSLRLDITDLVSENSAASGKVSL